MRFIKLGILSVVVFYLLIWGITMLFPNTTILSRVVNIAGNSDSLQHKIKANQISYRQWLIGNDTDVDIRTSDISFYRNDLVNAERQAYADTIYFEMRYRQKSFMQGGIALYQLSPDSVTTQLYYVFKTDWYKPWDKMKQMANDAKYGSNMDSSLALLKILAQGK